VGEFTQSGELFPLDKQHSERSLVALRYQPKNNKIVYNLSRFYGS
jgi:hypothetical protein